jgi:hypothetical protein
MIFFGIADVLGTWLNPDFFHNTSRKQNFDFIALLETGRVISPHPNLIDYVAGGILFGTGHMGGLEAF